jgi:gliding motility-associated-like protein
MFRKTHCTTRPYGTRTLMTRAVACALLALTVSGSQAQIDASRRAGCGELFVTFKPAQPQQSGFTYRWELGRGPVSNEYSPVMIYPATGTYPVRLEITDPTGNKSIHLDTIRVFPVPKLGFEADDTTGCFPHRVNFRDTTAPGAGTISRRFWFFGDGNTATDNPTPAHTYATFASSYSVSLRVVQSTCPQDTFTLNKTGYIQVTQGVKPSFSAQPPSVCKPPISIRFTNTSQAGAGQTIRYDWTFTNGNPTVSTQKDPVVQFNSAGSFKVRLLATSSAGCADSVIEDIKIPNVTVKSDFIMISDTVCQGRLADFMNNSNPAPDSSFWYFGNEPPVQGVNQFKIFSAPGIYPVKMVNKFGACRDSVTKNITVTAAPVVSFTSPNRFNCKAPQTIDFSYTAGSPALISSYEWDFGDGTKQSGNQPTVSHSYTKLGSYPVALTVTDKFGCSSRGIVDSFVVIAQPLVTNVNLVDSGCVNLRFEPKVNIFAPDGVASYAWDFGDGGPVQTIPNPVNIYTTARAAEYPLSLTIITREGCQAKVNGSVKIGTKPGIPDFSGTPRNMCAGDTAQFSDLSPNPGSLTGWYWQFGDGGTARAPSPAYVYTDTGTFTVKLTTYNNGCASATASKMDYMRIGGARASFIYIVDCNDRRNFRFVNTSTDADSYEWNWGDGSPKSTLKDPGIHSFTGYGTFPVTLTLRKGNCTNFSTLLIRVINDTAEFTVRSASTGSLCGGTTLIFDAIKSNPDNIRKYEWDYGDGIFVEGNRSASRAFPDRGTYYTRLRITDLYGCSRTYNAPPLGIGGPRAGMTAPVRQGCKGLEVNFTDTSRFDGMNKIVSRFWDLGDGTRLTKGPDQTALTHKYTDTGSFRVKLIVTDEKGCADSMILVNYVTVTDPQVDFTADDTLSCPGAFIRFKNETKMRGGTFNWTFGDGKTGNTPDPVHRFDSAGVYSIRLYVRDFIGCEAFKEKSAYIRIDTPYADFDLSDSFSRCPPLTPSFGYKGRFAKTITWSFGDGGVSGLTVPTQIYYYPGTYVARLIVTSPGGCTDTASKTIRILGPIGKLVYNEKQGCDTLKVNFRMIQAFDVDSTIWDFDDGVRITRFDTASYIYRRAGFYNPRLILKNKEGCTVSYPRGDTIRVIGIDPQFSSTNYFFCEKGTAEFTNKSTSTGNINGHLWEFGDGAGSAQKDPSHTYAAPGTYPVSLTVTTTEGCRKKVTFPNTIKVYRLPVADILGDSVVCQEGSLRFSGVDRTVPADTTTLSWFWDFGNGLTAATKNPDPQIFRAAGTTTVRMTLTNGVGCQGATQKRVIVNPLPITDPGPDTTICLGQSVTLATTGAATYAWRMPAPGLSCTGCSAPVATPTASTTYYVRGRTSLGCEADDSVTVTVVMPSQVSTQSTDTICVGESIQLNATGTQLYAWSPVTGLNNPNIPNPIATPAVTTIYTVRGSDIKGCFTSVQTSRIVVYAYPTVALGADIKVAVGTPVPLKPVLTGPATRYLWSPTAGLSCTDCPDPIAKPMVTTNYKLTVSNEGGCSATDAMTLTVLCGEGNLFMPNTFSPNGDGANDRYYPRGKGIQTVRSLRIFNRWGEMVYRRDNFNANDPTTAWDGRFQGRELPPDVFVYMIDVVCENQSIVTLKGDVALIR